jgi:hypothetical protein
MPEVRIATPIEWRNLRHGVCSDRFVYNPKDDTFRALVLQVLQENPAGVRKADVMTAARDAGLSVSEHAYSKVLRDLCEAQGAVWKLKEGATFRDKL